MKHKFAGDPGPNPDAPHMIAEYDDETDLFVVTAGDVVLPPLPPKTLFFLSTFVRQLMEAIANDHAATVEGPRGEQAYPVVPHE